MPNIKPQVLDRLYAFVKPFEGCIDHMYLDTEGNVTAGLGFQLPTLHSAKGLPFLPAEHVERDFEAIRRSPVGRPASYYEPITLCRLRPEDMRAEFDRRARGFAESLNAGGYKLDTYPEAALVAILDMAYNMGAGPLISNRHWPLFRVACMHRNWVAAAQHCHRKDIPDLRNNATVALFLEATRNGFHG